MTQEVLVVSTTELLVQEVGGESLVEQAVTQEVLTVAEQGPPGPPGGGVALLGRLANLAALPVSGDLGDLYIIEAEANHGYVWDGAAWTDTGPIQGPQGDAGPAGATGPTGATGATGAAGINGTNGTNGQDGASAYAVAVANGFVGTEAAWLASLVGPTGATGATGSQGIQGIQGIQGSTGSTGATGAAGADGADGQSAYELALVDGFVGTLAQWLDSLVGPTGATGATGAAGIDGAPGADGSPGADGAPGVGVPIGGTTGQVLAKTSATDYATAWVDPAGGGTVTSVGLTVPAGLAVAGSPVTGSGTLAISYSAGYSIPADATQANWSTAFGWGNHASAGYQAALVSGTSIKTINGTSLLGAGDVAITGGGVTVAATAPASPAEGDQWYDTTSGIQYTRVATSWVEPV